jgi:hypothetical protein
MLCIKIINSIFIMINLLNFVLTSSISLNNLECTIKNGQFSSEYLFKDDSNQNEKANKNIKQNVYLYPLKKIQNLELVIWKFIRVESNNSDIYFIKTESNDEFLCSSHRINHMLKLNHKFHSIKESYLFTTIKATKTMLNNKLKDCKWRLDQLKSENNSNSTDIGYFNISNMNGNKYLYASSGFFEPGDYKRNVYIWNKPSKLESFKWKIDCSLNLFQNYIE